MEPNRHFVRTIDGGNHRVLAAITRLVDESAHEAPADPRTPFVLPNVDRILDGEPVTAKHTELHSTASAMAAADHTRWGAEQRARNTAVAILAAVQNGTYACARVLQACSALGGLGHAANRIGVRGQATTDSSDPLGDRFTNVGTPQLHNR